MMKFVATDGTIFTNRTHYRKHEMETQYTFRNKNNETLIKERGSVQGQPFNIVNCNNCTIIIPDYCDQVQIDDSENTKIFIGASSESIFVRDCKNCSFTIACKQLRTRDCQDCTFYLYCKTEPIIERSSNIRFAPFNGAYPNHNDDMIKANLIPEKNLWFAVYDFNDEDKSQNNWSYINLEDEDDTWCPLGPATNCCLRVEPDSITSQRLQSQGDKCYKFQTSGLPAAPYENQSDEIQSSFEDSLVLDKTSSAPPITPHNSFSSIQDIEHKDFSVNERNDENNLSKVDPFVMKLTRKLEDISENDNESEHSLKYYKDTLKDKIGRVVNELKAWILRISKSKIRERDETLPKTSIFKSKLCQTRNMIINMFQNKASIRILRRCKDQRKCTSVSKPEQTTSVIT